MSSKEEEYVKIISGKQNDGFIVLLIFIGK